MKFVVMHVLRLVLLCGGVAAMVHGQDAADLRLDLNRATDGTPVAGEIAGDGYALRIAASYDASTQVLVVTGHYRTTAPIDPASVLSYQVYGDNGELLMADGARYGWDASSEGELTAEFALDLPMLTHHPALRVVRVQFNAVLEGQFWYRDAHPEIVFPAVELAGIPRRDSYRAGWTWIPHFLPAQRRCWIPVWWQVQQRDALHSGYQAVMDVRDIATGERVESRRVAFANEITTGRAFAWLPMEPTTAHTIEVRPGLVWDDVRWYDAEGWFAYRSVRLVPPLIYVGALLLALGGWWLSWRETAGWQSAPVRIAARVALLAAAVWLATQVAVSGSWPAVSTLMVVGWLKGRRWSLPGLRTYAVIWVFLVFVEVYWGQMSGEVKVRSAATLFSLAVWAAVLLPLVWLRRRSLRWTVAAIVACSWLLLTTLAVIYHHFFQDFPSVENALYANQVGELGDSIFSLVEQRHMTPLLIGIAMGVVLWWPPRRDQRKTQAENR